MNQEIQKYLTGEILDFNEGFALFCKYSKNESLISWIGRKKDMERLIYNLKKLNGFPNLKANAKTEELIIKYNRPVDAVVAAMPSAPIQQETSEPADTSTITFRTFDDRKTRRSDLPEDLQKVYDDIAGDFKLRRAYHEKMKMATTDEDRAQLRAKILETEDRNRNGWATIDKFLLEQTQQTVTTAFKETTVRSYISKKLKKENLTPEDIEQLKIRVKALLDHGCIIKDAVAEKLRALNIL